MIFKGAFQGSEHTDFDDDDEDPKTEEASVNYYMLWDIGDPNTIPDFSKSREVRLGAWG